MPGKDPLDPLKRIIGYAAVIMWVAVFGVSLFRPVDASELLAVQAVLMLVAGGLYAERYRVPSKEPEPPPEPPSPPIVTPPPKRKPPARKRPTTKAGDV